MKKRPVVFIILILTVLWLIPSLSFAEMTVTGVTKTFNPQSRRLVLTTTSQTETTLSIPQTVTVYIKTKTEDIEVADVWKYLGDNLFKGTKVTIEKTEGVVTTIWVLEVPH